MGGRASPLIDVRDIALGEPVGLVRRLQPCPSGSDGSAELYNPALFAASSAAMVLGQPGTTSGTSIRVRWAPGVDSCGAPAIDCHSLGELFVTADECQQRWTPERAKKHFTNRAVQKQRQLRLFQTVNHAKIIWNSECKPKGILGGHINIRSILPKIDQIRNVLKDPMPFYFMML